MRKLSGCLVLIRKTTKWSLIILAVLTTIGVILQLIATARDKQIYHPRGEFYEVNGIQMHLVCIGDGEPSVILQAGGVAESLWWYRVQEQLAAKGITSCAYDRAGLGWSETATTSRDALTLTSELHKLLEVANIKGPYVMVGHSLGAVLARIYTQQCPDQVSGLVLVDSALLIPKSFQSESEYLDWKRANDPLQFIVWSLTRIGLVRLMVQNDFRSFGYPEEIIGELTALRASNQTADTDYAERVPTMWNLQKAAANAEDFGSLPMAVLWASSSNDVLLTEEAKNIYFTAKDEIKTYSDNSFEREIEGANHGSILGNAEYAAQVVEAIVEIQNSTIID